MSNPMQPQALREALEALNLTQAAFSRFIGVTPRTVQQWVQNDAKIPGAVALLVRYMLAKDISAQAVLAAVYASQPEQDPAPARVSP